MIDYISDIVLCSCLYCSLILPDVLNHLVVMFCLFSPLGRFREGRTVPFQERTRLNLTNPFRPARFPSSHPFPLYRLKEEVFCFWLFLIEPFLAPH